MDKYPQATFPGVTQNGQTTIPSIPKLKADGTTFSLLLIVLIASYQPRFLALAPRLDSFFSDIRRKLVVAGLSPLGLIVISSWRFVYILLFFMIKTTNSYNTCCQGILTYSSKNTQHFVQFEHFSSLPLDTNTLSHQNFPIGGYIYTIWSVDILHLII